MHTSRKKKDDGTRALAFGLALGLCLVSGAYADTVHFKDGSTIDGVVSTPNPDTIAIDAGTGRVTFPAADVARIEKNDKKGDVANLINRQSKQHQDSITERTGLTEQQRDLVRAVVDPLWSPDEGERNAARRKLVEMSKQMPVFQYIESCLPYTKPLVVPEFMKTLVAIDPQRAKGVIAPYTQDRTPGTRAKALELIGAYGKEDDVETLSRGLVDLEPSVRISAAHALGEAGSKGATPALIEQLKNVDPKVQNAARAALKQLWSSANVKADLNTVEEWKTFWTNKAGSVKDPVDPKSLVPLVSQEDLALTSPNHDE